MAKSFYIIGILVFNALFLQNYKEFLCYPGTERLTWYKNKHVLNLVTSMTTTSKVSTIKHDLKARLWLVEIGRVVPTTVFHCWREKLQSRYSQTRAD